MYIKNITQGPKTVNTPTGQVSLDPGQARDDLDLSEGERVSAESTGWFSFEKGEDDKASAGEGRKIEVDADELEGKFKAALEANRGHDVAEINRLIAVNDDLASRLQAVTDENASLKQQLEAALAAKGEPATTVDQSGGNDTSERLYEARDTGSGWWTIFDQDENTIGNKVRKDVAEAFNGKSDDEKAAFVAEHTAAQD